MRALPLFCAGSIAASLLMATNAFAAIPSKSSGKETKSQVAIEIPKVRLEVTREALRMSLDERLSALQGQGPGGYKNLMAIMFDQNAPMEMRWRAVTAAGLIGQVESKPEIERALRSKEWFMRNAGLVAMTTIDRTSAIDWAKTLLSDKALVVRSAAIEALVDLKASDSSALLWKKLYSKENFKNGHSLFIRKRIVEALAKSESSGAERKFLAVLSDKDKSLHAPAVAGLERLTGRRLDRKMPLSLQLDSWKQYLDNRKL